MTLLDGIDNNLTVSRMGGDTFSGTTVIDNIQSLRTNDEERQASSTNPIQLQKAYVHSDSSNLVAGMASANEGESMTDSGNWLFSLLKDVFVRARGRFRKRPPLRIVASHSASIMSLGMMFVSINASSDTTTSEVKLFSGSHAQSFQNETPERPEVSLLINELSTLRSEHGSKSVAMIFDNFSEWIENGEFALCDQLMWAADPKKYHVETTLAILTVTLSAKRELHWREWFRDKCYSYYIEKSGRAKADRLVSGI